MTTTRRSNTVGMNVQALSHNPSGSSTVACPDFFIQPHHLMYLLNYIVLRNFILRAITSDTIIYTRLEFDDKLAHLLMS